MLVAAVLLCAAAAVRGRECATRDVFKDGDYAHGLVATVAGCTSLNINSNNALGDAIAAAIAEALKTNTAVTALNLWDNSIGDAGATALAEMLKVNTAVARLSLVYNKIGDTASLDRNKGTRDEL
eukprot:gene10564-30780_t